MKVEIKGDKEIKNSFSSTEITDELFSPGRGSEEMAKEEVAFDVAGYVLVSAKREIKSEVENAFIPYFSIFFNLFSLDQSPISCPLLLKNRDRATYGTSFKCEDNIFSAIDKEPSNKSFGTIFINNGKEKNIISKSCGERRNLEQISSLCFPTSSNTYFGANRSKSYFNSGSKISSLVVLPFLKKEKRTLASTTNFILAHRAYLTRPYLLAKSSFTALPNLKQSSSDSLLFSVILLNTDSSNFLNAFDLSNLNSANLSSIASKANLDLSTANSSISFSNSSGILNLNSAISITANNVGNAYINNFSLTVTTKLHRFFIFISLDGLFYGFNHRFAYRFFNFSIVILRYFRYFGNPLPYFEFFLTSASAISIATNNNNPEYINNFLTSMGEVENTRTLSCLNKEKRAVGIHKK